VGDFNNTAEVFDFDLVCGHLLDLVYAGLEDYDPFQELRQLLRVQRILRVVKSYILLAL